MQPFFENHMSTQTFFEFCDSLTAATVLNFHFLKNVWVQRPFTSKFNNRYEPREQTFCLTSVCICVMSACLVCVCRCLCLCVCVCICVCFCVSLWVSIYLYLLSVHHLNQDQYIFILQYIFYVLLTFDLFNNTRVTCSSALSGHPSSS